MGHLIILGLIFEDLPDLYPEQFRHFIFIPPHMRVQISPCILDKTYCLTFFFFLTFGFIYLFIYLFYGCVGSSFLCEGFLQLRQVGATLHRGARASHYRGLSCCGAQAPDAQAQ